GAVRPVGQVNDGATEPWPLADAAVDLVAFHRDGAAAEADEGAIHPAQLLLRVEAGADGQKAEARAFPGLALDTVRVGDTLAEHLEAAADPQHLAAVAQVAEQV